MNNEMNEDQIRAANRRFDQQFPHFRRKGARIPSAWRAHRLIMGAPLSDGKIEAYRGKGYYSESIKDARAVYLERKRKYIW